MRRLLAAVAGLLLIGAGVLVAPRGGYESRDPTLIGALGRSAGGLRVLASDVLFLRAEQLRREGRIEEVPALYEAVMRLEPENPAAVEFLAGIQAYDLVNGAPDAEARRRWWNAAWDLTEEGRRLFPDDPSLLLRQADLLLDVPVRHPDVLAAVAERVADAPQHGLGLLLEAARRTSALPRRGRQHLLMLSEMVPGLAAGRDPAAAEPILAIGEEALRVRPRVLREMLWLGRADGEDGETTVERTRYDYLERGMATVRALHRAAASGDVEGMRRLRDEWKTWAPDSAFSQILARLVARLVGRD